MTDRRYRYVLSFLCFSAFAAPGVGATLKDSASEASCASGPIKVEGSLYLYKCTTAEGDIRYFNYVDETVKPSPPPRPPSPAGTIPASRWLSLTNDGKTDIEIDTQRPVGSGVMRSAWFRWSYTEIQDLAPYGYKYQSALLLTYYNCKEQTSASVYAQYFEKPHVSGKQIYVAGKAVQPPASEYQQTIPGSYGEVLMKYVCGIR